MPDQSTELRCPTCGKLLIGFSADFDGAVSTKCGRCKQDSTYPEFAVVSDVPILCGCRKWLARGEVQEGSIRVLCKRDRVLAIVSPSGVVLAEESRATPVRRRRHPDLRPMVEREGDLVTMIEQRWQGHRNNLVRRSVEIAVGLRFDVFNRDGFRCVYCGRGPHQGVYLEADHHIPRSAGGSDTMANLVTSCWDCNRGKAAKRVEGLTLAR